MSLEAQGEPRLLDHAAGGRNFGCSSSDSSTGGGSPWPARSRWSRSPSQPHGQEPALPLEPLGPLRQLRRLGDEGAHHLGPEVRPRRGRSDHLVELSRPSAGTDHPGIRPHRPGRQHPLLARARSPSSRARLPLHHPDRVLGTSARHRRDRVPEGLELDGEAKTLHGFPFKRMSVEQIREVVSDFGRAAYRAPEAGADGVEVPGATAT